jgi:excisionase family DNA binding protein
MAAMLRLEQVSKRLGDTPIRTIRHWIACGRLRAYKPGRHPLVKEADLDAFVSAAAMVPESEER